MAHLGHGTGELGGGDVAIAVAIERSEDLQQLLLIDENIVVHVGENGIDQFVEFDGAVAVGIHVGEERVELVAGGLDAEGAEEGAELELGEAAVGVHVEAPENVVQLLELVGLNGSHGFGSSPNDSTRSAAERNGWSFGGFGNWRNGSVRDVGLRVEAFGLLRQLKGNCSKMKPRCLE